MHYVQDPAECRLLRSQRTKILRTPWPASSSSTSELSRTWRLPPSERAEASYKTHDDVSDIQHMDFSVIIIVRLLFPLLIRQRFVFVTAFLLSSSLSDTRLVRLCSQLFAAFLRPRLAFVAFVHFHVEAQRVVIFWPLGGWGFTLGSNLHF